MPFELVNVPTHNVNDTPLASVMGGKLRPFAEHLCVGVGYLRDSTAERWHGTRITPCLASLLHMIIAPASSYAIFMLDGILHVEAYYPASSYLPAQTASWRIKLLTLEGHRYYAETVARRTNVGSDCFGRSVGGAILDISYGLFDSDEYSTTFKLNKEDNNDETQEAATGCNNGDDR